MGRNHIFKANFLKLLKRTPTTPRRRTPSLFVEAAAAGGGITVMDASTDALLMDADRSSTSRSALELGTAASELFDGDDGLDEEMEVAEALSRWRRA